MSKKKLLFITEGEIDEPKFIEVIFKKCYPSVEYEYYAYTTDVYTLVRLIFNKNGNIDEYIDIKNILKENETNEFKREILSRKYSDIVLVFDFDPHSTNPEFEKLGKMLDFFDDSTNNGKLYINYPMMQSYKHILTYPQEDYGFKDRKIRIEDCSEYKEIINIESFCLDIKKYTFPIIIKIAGYQLKKANYILNGKYAIPNYKEFYDIKLKSIYNKQYQMMNKDKTIYVLNTFIFNLIEYNPKILLDKIKEFD